jgi:SAM-dependent methyltransferase
MPTAAERGDDGSARRQGAGAGVLQVPLAGLRRDQSVRLERADADRSDRPARPAGGRSRPRRGLCHGLDQSRHQLERAWAKFGKTDRVRFYRGDAERLPFGDDAFDAVWSSGSIEYWPDPVAALREFRRVVRPGGGVLVVGPDAPHSSVFERLADAIMLFYDEAEADRMFDAAGFETFDHRIQQARPGSPRAITTIAYAPE